MRNAPISCRRLSAFAFTALLFAVLTPQAFAQQAIYIIRHGEKELSGTDPALTDAGRERAAAWAEMLRLSDLKIILTSDAKRTRETGGIVARSLGIPHKALPVQDVAGLTDLIEFDHEDDNVLIVGHTETIPQTLSNLGLTEVVDISESDFSSLLILLRRQTNEPQLIRLRMPAR
jgi:broad specificity phosphatase PhoE